MNLGVVETSAVVVTIYPAGAAWVAVVNVELIVIAMAIGGRLQSVSF